MTTITAPLTSITLAALVPDVVRSCVVLQPSPPPDPGEAPPAPVTGPGIYTPIAPGVTYANLPVAPTIVDTSPDQMIGCIVTVADNPQGRLNALFPSAVDGDGVIDRATNDIWVYDGATWNNVGPTPGPTLVATTVIPPWNETLLAVARTRTKLSVNALAYALQLLTEPDPIVTTTALAAKSRRVVKVPATDIALAAQTPTYDNPYSEIYSAVPTRYTGNGTTQTISSLPWSPGIVWIKGINGLLGHVFTDVARGPTAYFLLNASSAEVTDSQHVSSYTANGFTVGNASRTNGNLTSYVSWSFPPVSSAVTNTAGTITSTVRANDFYSIALYSGASADRTFGHGLAGTPEFIMIKPRNSFVYAAVAGGSVVGTNSYLTLNLDSIASLDTSRIKSANSTTVSLGNSDGVNGTGINYVAYCFRSLPGVCKIGTYTGDGNVAGQTINCGFKVQFLIVKSKTNTNGSWVLIDPSRGQGNERLTTASAAQTLSTVPFYELTATGFKALRGDQTTVDDLNVASTEYIYIAFASVRPTVLTPLVDMLLEAEEPTVTAN